MAVKKSRIGVKICGRSRKSYNVISAFIKGLLNVFTHAVHLHPIRSPSIQTPPMLVSDKDVLPHQYAHFLHNIVHPDILQNIYLKTNEPDKMIFGARLCILCITLPKASSTAWEVKFSDGMRLIKCFCRLFSYSQSLSTSSRMMWKEDEPIA